MSNLIGSGVRDPNLPLRLMLIVFGGILAIGAVSYWRAELYVAADYQPMPVTHQQIKIIDENNLIKKELYGQN
jgi:hypothetical protein